MGSPSEVSSGDSRKGAAGAEGSASTASPRKAPGRRLRPSRMRATLRTSVSRVNGLLM
jgi:hypothetical protein